MAKHIHIDLPSLLKPKGEQRLFWGDNGPVERAETKEKYAKLEKIERELAAQERLKRSFGSKPVPEAILRRLRMLQEEHEKLLAQVSDGAARKAKDAFSVKGISSVLSSVREAQSRLTEAGKNVDTTDPNKRSAQGDLVSAMTQLIDVEKKLKPYL